MDSFNPETLYRDLQVAAAQTGSSISEICRDAGIPRNTLANWQKKMPKSFVLLGKLLTAIEAKKPVASK